ncbi:MAG: hypothetical protein GTO02_14050 [Candidatus Dadabacteria bacterium]|nr:hypothetical protein [Candidatus Dadabacteria bacterium]NIQ15471.1 hypothetical protein [Candidatus Dadabacteria bacterium]
MYKKLSIIFLFLFAFTSCSGIGKSLIKSPDLSVTHISVSKLSLEEQDINLKLRIDNPNPYALPIRGFSYKFFINDSEFIDGYFNNKFDIKANDNSTIELKLSGNLLSFLKKLDISILKNIDYKIKGDIAILIGNLTFPYEYNGKLSIIIVF